jgi:GDP-L-fucose synthase
MKSGSRIYVAGHRGLVGSALTRALAGRGFPRVLTQTRVQLDLRDPQRVLEFFRREQPEYVFLAAARVGGIRANSTQPAEFIHDNLLIQTSVIDAAHRTGTRRLIFFGSNCLYPRSCPQPMKEDQVMTGRMEPTSEAYSVAKLAGLTMCEAYNRQHGTQFLTVIPATLYGPGAHFDPETSHVLPALMRRFHEAKVQAGAPQPALVGGASAGLTPARALGGLGGAELPPAQRASAGFTPARALGGLGGAELPPAQRASAGFTPARAKEAPPAVTVWGTGSPVREFLYVDDLADACLFLAGLEGPFPTSPINVGTGAGSSIRELAAEIASVVGFEGEVVFDSRQPDGAPRKVLDSARIRALGWSPRTPLVEGLRQTYAWFLEHRC